MADERPDAFINSLSEHIQSNAECLQRMMLLVAKALPHMDG